MGKEVAVQPRTRTVHVLCHAYGRKLIVIDLAWARNTVLYIGLSSVGGKCASFVVSQKATAVGTGVILCASVGILNWSSASLQQQPDEDGLLLRCFVLFFY